MTTLHQAPGEARPEGFFDGEQLPEQVVVVEQPEQPTGRGMSRRRAMWLLFGGGGAVAATVVTVGVVASRRPNSQTALRTDGQETDGSSSGGQAGAGNGAEEGETRLQDPQHIYRTVMSNPGLQVDVRRFVGSDDVTFADAGTKPYPWMQITTGNQEYVTVTQRPAGVDTAGERAPTWAERQTQQGFDASQWTVFEGGTRIRINDQYERGLQMADLTGYANIGTDQERMFTIETQYLANLGSMDAAGRRAQIVGFTSAMLGAQAIG